MPEVEPYRTDPASQLKSAIGFDDDDLVANRARRLGPRQRQALARAARRSTTAWITGITAGALILGVPTAMALTGLVISLVRGDVETAMDQMCGLIIGGTFTAMVPMIMAGALSNRRNRLAALRATAPVRHATGAVTVAGPRHVHVGGPNLRLVTTEAAVELFGATPDGRYTVFFLHNPEGDDSDRNTLLTAEPA